MTSPVQSGRSSVYAVNIHILSQVGFADVWEEKELGKYKIDAQGNLIDMTRIGRKEIAELERYYVSKWNQARSPDMKLAYRESVDQIRKFAYEGKIADNADVFYIAHRMDVVDIRGMIKRYYGSLPEFKRREGEREFSRLFAERTAKYVQPSIPPDETIRRIYDAVMAEPPKLQDAADIFANSYGIATVSVEVGTRKDYSMTTNFKGKLYVSLDKFERDIDLLEALCELLFNHLSTCRSWRFGDDAETSFTREKEERIRFAIAILDRCVDMGLLNRRDP